MPTALMPVYNAAPFVAEAIESVLAQTHAAFELLILDDGSTDGSGDIARSYAARDSRIRLIQQPNAGIAHTMNRGIEMIRDEWVFCMHGDDVMAPNRLERQLDFIKQNPDLAVVSSRVDYIDSNGKTLGRARSPYVRREVAHEAVAAGRMVAFCHPATAFRREAVKAAGGYRQEFWPAEDGDLWTRLVERGHGVAVQDECLLKYRIHGASASIRRNRLMQQRILWIEACMKARSAGKPEPTAEQFDAAARGDSWPAWLNRQRHEWGRTFYQASLHHLSARHYKQFIPQLLAAAVLEPGLVLSRVLPRLGLAR